MGEIAVRGKVLCWSSKSQMTKQKYEACTVRGKTVTIEGSNLAWENLDKRLDRISVQNPGKNWIV